MFIWLNISFIIIFVDCAIPQKNFPWKNWEQCNFLFPHDYNLHIFGSKICLCNFPKLFYCVEGFFEAWNLFLNVFYLQSFGILEIIIDNIRRNLKNMQFGKIAAAGYKCNLRVANKDLGFSMERTFRKMCNTKKSVTLWIENTYWSLLLKYICSTFISVSLIISYQKSISILK